MARTPPRPRPPRRSSAPTLRIVWTTVPPRRAAALARALVRARVAACVQVLPGIRSVYRWKGAVEEAAEALLSIKTTRGALPRCLAVLTRAHPYEVPEIVVVAPEAVSAPYAAWVVDQTRPGPVEPVAGHDVRRRHETK